MLPLKLSDLNIEQFSALTIQALILISNAAFFFAGKVNNFFAISTVLIFSLFVLQSINHRFLLLDPVNIFMERNVKSGDTQILKLLILVSSWFLLLGAAKVSRKSIGFLEFFEGDWLLYLVVIFFFVFPLFWILGGYKLVRKHVVKQLKNKPFITLIKCPFCEGHAERIRKIVDWNKGLIEIKCYDKCRKKESEGPKIYENKITLNIAS